MAAQEASREAAAQELANDAGKVRAQRVRYATKTALALTLAYLLPMALGWPQPQTAATTVMLIAAAGAVSESLQKGVLRVMGTVAGAVIGLGLIALFPQERLAYLFAVSIVVATLVYLYNAYQGDSTAFMLTSVVTLMVFNGGDAEGAFLYGVDRAHMTVFGVIIYTLVASMLWPVRVADNTRALAAGLCRDFGSAAAAILRPGEGNRGLSGDLLENAEAFHTHYAAVRNSTDNISDFAAEWQQITACLEALQDELVPALHSERANAADYGAYITNHGEVTRDLQARFEHAARTLDGEPHQGMAASPAIAYDETAMAQAGHIVTAFVATRVRLLTQLQGLLGELQVALDSLMHDRRGFRQTRSPQRRPAFIWSDVENLRTALRAFTTFWLATAIWIVFNPPGGFTFVTMCTILVPLVSYTPVTPKLLVILLSLGFFFALPAYIFLLPHLTHWLQLAIFIFGYAFIGFLLFAGPVSIFFLLGLFTLGIQNEMSYNVDVLLLIMLMFYMVCATLVATLYFPFTSRAGPVYRALGQRFFRYCARDLSRAWDGTAGSSGKRSLLLTRMLEWGAKLEGGSDDGPVANFNRSCELLHAHLLVARRRLPDFADNPLVKQLRQRAGDQSTPGLCMALAEFRGAEQFAGLEERLGDVDRYLDEFLGDNREATGDRKTLGLFYTYLALQTSILSALKDCHDAQQCVDWRSLQRPGI